MIQTKGTVLDRDEKTVLDRDKNSEMKKLYPNRDENSVLSGDGRKNECRCLIILKLEQQALCLFLTSIFEVEVEVELID